MSLDLQHDDILTLKKPHACGANAWRVYRLGADIGLKCEGCGRRVMLPRAQVERRARRIQRGAQVYKPHELEW